MTTVLVSGGWFDDTGECWVERIWPHGRERLITFVPPRPHQVAEKSFTGLVLHGEHFLVCSFNAIWAFRRDGRCDGRLHMPHFNDLHGLTVDPCNGDILVCNTGMDAVERIASTGAWRGRYSLVPPTVEWRKFGGMTLERADLKQATCAGWDSPNPDAVFAEQINDGYYDSARTTPFSLRRVRDYFHPNHVFFTREYGLCVTSLIDRSVRSLSNFDTVVKFSEAPHDGIDEECSIWVTTVDGNVLKSSKGLTQRVCSLDQLPISGWCRGLALSATHIVVGVTAIRAQHSEVSWKAGNEATSKTALIWFDRETSHAVGMVDLTDPVRGAKVFAVVVEET